MLLNTRLLRDGVLLPAAATLALLAGYLPGSATPPAAAMNPATTAPGAPAMPAPPVDAAGRPPQFVVVSFDGAGSVALWTYYRNIARQVGAGLTFFLTGTYLLPDEKARQYRGPGFPAGHSDVGFGGAPTEVRARAEQLRGAHAEGHEIATHYNGHMCGSPGVASWNAAEWGEELDQFNRFLTEWRVNADAPDAVDLPFAPTDLHGSRTPCLEGRRAELRPVLAGRGFHYDSSGIGELRWPRKDSYGLWDIPLQRLTMAGSGHPVLSMDYNFFMQQGEGATPERREVIRTQMLRTYANAFEAVHSGNRTPLIIGHHFRAWNRGVYIEALGEFLRRTCTQPETRCVTFSQLIEWLDAQDPASLAALQALPVQKMRH